MTTHKKTHNEQHGKTHNKPRTSRTSVRLNLSALLILRMLAVLVLGSVALALACAPAVGGGHPSAPRAVTDITTDEANTDSTSFTVRWVAPASTGTKADGTALEPADIGYRIYYLAGTADQTTNQTKPSAESLRQDADVQTQEVTGVLRARIAELTPDTLYFVTVASYNTLAAQPSETVSETVSSEVVVATTSVAIPIFDRSLSYAETTHKFAEGLGGTITPNDTPTIPSGGSSATINYVLEIIDGTAFVPDLDISNRGVIMIDPTTNVGTARYFVQAEATSYTTQRVVLTITVNKTNFEGSLAYRTGTHRFTVEVEGTIEPTSTPFIPDTETRDVSIRYSLTRSTGTEFESAIGIVEESGIITINPSNTTLGIAVYTVRAEADTYNAKEATITISIVENANLLRVSTYYDSEATNVLPVTLGQAIADDSDNAFVIENNVVLTISDLTDEEHRIHFGTVPGSYSGSYTKTASDGAITISKSELAENSFSFKDGAVIGISGPGTTNTEHVATYYPSNIYSHYDLQAMRVDLTRNYSLVGDIRFLSPAGTDTSNYEAVGTKDDPFTGSLDGANKSDSDSSSSSSYSITGIQIDSATNYQGLFGVMEASSVDTVIAQNLVLKDFKITGGAYVGSLAGWVKQGTVDSVRVEVSTPDAGKVETRSGDYGGGLLSSAGTDTGDTQVRIQNTSSAATVFGVNSRMGGLVGSVGENVILTESYATGSVTGTESVGGLVGINYGMVTGHATGSVTGTKSTTGTESVGGLVGLNNGGTVTGYATGTVMGIDNVGGLVGLNNGGTVTGYATGSISGSYYLGGLVGSNSSSGTVTGYATGTVIASGYSSGGLVGLISNNSGSVSGYARGIVRRNGGQSLTFGKVVGQQLIGMVSSIFSSSSMFESKVYDGETGTAVLASTTGKDGTEVDIASATKDTFDRLTFGTNIGEWTWVEDVKWPAINIGDELKPAGEQPVGPVDR